jgi:type III secretion protein C
MPISIPARRRLGCCLTALALLAGGGGAAAAGSAAAGPVASIPWPDSPFTLMNPGHRLDKVLANFTQAFGLRLKLDEDLPEDAAPLQGRTAAPSPTEFLNQLGAIHGLAWYHADGTLHVARSSSRLTLMLPTKGLGGATLRRVLADMGLLESKFGWSDIDERGAVMVSGPPSYVARIEAAVKALPDAATEQQIQVYRLRYAAVDDRVITYRDKEITTPGVATVLRNLVSGASGGGTSTEVAELAAPLRGDPAARGGDAAPPARAPAARSGRTGASAGPGVAPVIQADTRLNAIIVKDRPQNAPIYRALIELLDVPSSLVEIEAMIVDVNSSSMSELGIDWSARAGRVGAEVSNGSIALSSGAGAGASVAASSANFILARIRALEGKGTAKVISRPSILTQDNMGALIDLADTFYIQTTGERVAQVTPVTVGVTLRVTPRVVATGDQRAVHLVVDIEDGAIQDVRIGALPTVRRSSISTQAMVNETQSLVIGGLNTEQQMQRRDAVPGLGDVPAVGVLFGKNSSVVDKRERLFLITPRLVAQAQPPHPAAPAAARPTAAAGATTAEARPATTAAASEGGAATAEPPAREVP